MPKIWKTELTDAEYNAVKRRLIKFYQTEKECSDKCPMGFTNQRPLKILQELESKLASICICQIFKELSKKGCGCPCYAYGKEAFERLAKVINKFETGEY